MEKDELVEFLKENLKIKTERKYDTWDGGFDIYLVLSIGNEKISSVFIEREEECTW